MQKKGFYEISIRDYGIGIDEKFKNLIFEPFKRLKVRDKFKGSSLGLSICQKIIESHDGSIWLDSTMQQGSTFHFALPGLNSN